jgi:ATP-dependent exoDNAse (exonuclease V) beta subunit
VKDISLCESRLKEFEAQAKLVRDRIDPSIGRIYTVPSGKKYVSVTTVLSAVADKSWLQEWRKAVGEDVADQITRDAANRGSSLHNIIERHYRGELLDIDRHSSGWNLYKSLLIYLKKIKPLSLELPLWSDHLRIAGRTDCIGIYEDRLSIIDFKSSRREKREEEINDYFLQCTLYAMMLYELLGIECKQIVVLIGSEKGFPQVFKRETRTYVKEAVDAVKRYYTSHEYICATNAV